MLLVLLYIFNVFVKCSPMNLNAFFNQNPVFRLEQLNQFLARRGSSNTSTRNSLLAYHRRNGKILTVRRGLYLVVPAGFEPESCPIDPFLVAAKLTPDAVLAYHTALEYHGKAYSIFDQFFCISSRPSVPLHFQNYRFEPILPPKSLQNKKKEYYGVIESERTGVDIRVTSLERTLVDVLDRPNLSGSWEEIWRSLESIEFFNLDKVIKYTQLLGNATTAAKVGFFLDQHREGLMVDNDYLNELKALCPKQPHYLERQKRKSASLVSDWNLIVPDIIINRSWAEVI